MVHCIVTVCATASVGFPIPVCIIDWYGCLLEINLLFVFAGNFFNVQQKLKAWIQCRAKRLAYRELFDIIHTAHT